MKLFKKILAGLLCAAMLVGTTACSGGSDTTADDSASTSTATDTSEINPGDLTIGGSFYDLGNEFFQKMAAGTKAQVEALGYKYQEHDQKNSETEMVTGATNLINSGVAALIISPCKPEALGSIVNLAQQNDIPVVIDDIGGGDTDYDVIVVSDCYKGGELAAEYTLEMLKEKGIEGKNFGSIPCEPSAVYAARRNQGFVDTMEAAGYTCVSEVTANSLDTEGYQVMKDMVASHPEIVAVFCGNDPMAGGAAQALEELGRTDILLSGFNGDQVALEAIKRGSMICTVAQDPELMGKTTADLADQLIRGKEIEYDDAETREIYADVFLIDAESEEVTSLEDTAE